MELKYQVPAGISLFVIFTLMFSIGLGTFFLVNSNLDQKNNQLSNQPMSAEVKIALDRLAKAQAKALKGSTWVGEKFAEASRKMHYGEVDQKPIHGQASLEEAQGLVDEGISVAPLPFPVTPPEKLN